MGRKLYVLCDPFATAISLVQSLGSRSVRTWCEGALGDRRCFVVVVVAVVAWGFCVVASSHKVFSSSSALVGMEASFFFFDV